MSFVDVDSDSKVQLEVDGLVCVCRLYAASILEMASSSRFGVDADGRGGHVFDACCNVGAEDRSAFAYFLSGFQSLGASPDELLNLPSGYGIDIEMAVGPDVVANIYRYADILQCLSGCHSVFLGEIGIQPAIGYSGLQVPSTVDVVTH